MHFLKIYCRAFPQKIDQFHKSLNAPVPYPTRHHSEQKCTHLVHCGIWDRCIMWIRLIEICPWGSYWPRVSTGSGDEWVPTSRDCFFANMDYPLIPAWINNHIHYEVWAENIYPFSNFNSTGIEIWEWISNFVPQSTEHVIIYPCWDQSYSVLERGPSWHQNQLPQCWPGISDALWE